MAQAPANFAGSAAGPTLPDRPWLHALALLVVVLIFILVAIGGNVTSLGAGLAVPDGFYTFGYWTPLAPLKSWAYDVGTFWEHSHRLQGYVVGLPAIALMVSLWWREVYLARRRGEQPRRWLAWVGTGLIGLGLAQAVMGILRVDLISTPLAMVHGIVGQLILAVAVLIAAATSKPWLRLVRDPARRCTPLGRGMRFAAWGLLALLVLQLIAGAAVRHTGATLAIPDFPATYGQVLPPTSPEALDRAWQTHDPVQAGPDASSAQSPYTIGQVHLHFTHRVLAGVLLAWGLVLAILLAVKAPDRAELRAPRVWLATLLAVQVLLGALVIWQGGYPAIATAHQATGAALLAVATWLALRVHLLAARPEPAGAPTSPAHPTPPGSAQGSPA
jgi:cytochrome c oxidase assembly protein subunit 15